MGMVARLLSRRRGIAATFEAARKAFEAAWTELLATIPEGAFPEWRQDRDWRAEVAAKRARGENSTAR
jgi:hypothetical protein